MPSAIHRAFGVPLVAIKRSTKLYRERSAAGFFAPKARREGTKLNAETLEQARGLLAQGHPLTGAAISSTNSSAPIAQS